MSGVPENTRDTVLRTIASDFLGDDVRAVVVRDADFISDDAPLSSDVGITRDIAPPAPYDAGAKNTSVKRHVSNFFILLRVIIT